MAARAPLPEALRAPPRGRVLALAPHADDEVIGLGGTLALHARQGDTVAVLVPFCASELRREEARAGGRILGVHAYTFWDLPENHVPTETELEQGVARLAAHVRAFAPDVVYAPWAGEHHLDHHVLARAAERALERAGFRGEAWSYEVWTPLIAERVLDVTDVWERKRAALSCHRSQLGDARLLAASVGLAAQRALYLRGGTRAEAFARLRPGAERAA